MIPSRLYLRPRSFGTPGAPLDPELAMPQPLPAVQSPSSKRSGLSAESSRTAAFAGGRRSIGDHESLYDYREPSLRQPVVLTSQPYVTAVPPMRSYHVVDPMTGLARSAGMVTTQLRPPAPSMMARPIQYETEIMGDPYLGRERAYADPGLGREAFIDPLIPSQPTVMLAAPRTLPPSMLRHRSDVIPMGRALPLEEEDLGSPIAISRATKTREATVKKAEEEALVFMGTTGRDQKNGMYFDASVLADPDAASLANRTTRGGVSEPFQEKLHRMLTEAETNGNDEIISFCPHGRAFIIHKHERFVKEVLPKYYNQTQMSSFLRQLNLYGFTRISSGPDEGGYYHELFLRGRPALCTHMRRVGVPGSGQGPNGKHKKGPRRPTHADPDFYTMAPITIHSQKTAIPKPRKTAEKKDNDKKEDKDDVHDDEDDEDDEKVVQI